MKRTISILIALVLLLLFTIPAAAYEPLYQREEADGAYVTIRVPYDAPEDLKWTQSRYLCVRYADTNEPVSLVSDFYQGYLFATVPASEAHRPLQAFQGQRFSWTDFPRGGESMSANVLYLRGVVQGDSAGRFAPKAPLTYAQAVVLIARLLSLPDQAGETWYAASCKAAEEAGLLTFPLPEDWETPISRAAFTTLLYNAFHFLGWADFDEEALDFLDADAIPAWAREAYQALTPVGLVPRPNEEVEPSWEDGPPIQRYFACPEAPMTREEGCDLIDQARRRLPCYPRPLAVEWGFDEAMPVIDGSTSTYPYTQALYSILFSNSTRHPQFPVAHSTSYASYENLMNGTVDVLFAAAKASSEQTAAALDRGVTFTYVPIAHDAMVFFTNVENSIEGLTSDQIRDIYVDNDYQNWSEIGGPDAALLPYCRNTDSGSHALMERYFLHGGALHPDILQGNVSQAMSSALTDVAAALQTDPPAYAIGYSVYYYYLTASTMMGDVTDNQLKLLKIDGVAPTDATIADGSYPLSDYNYLVFRSGDTNPLVETLRTFMTGEHGRAVAEQAGFGPLS